MRVYRDLGHILNIFPKLLICDAKIGFVVVGLVGWGGVFVILGFFTSQFLAEEATGAADCASETAYLISTASFSGVFLSEAAFINLCVILITQL